MYPFASRCLRVSGKSNMLATFNCLLVQDQQDIYKIQLLSHVNLITNIAYRHCWLDPRSERQPRTSFYGSLYTRTHQLKEWLEATYSLPASPMTKAASSLHRQVLVLIERIIFGVYYTLSTLCGKAVVEWSARRCSSDPEDPGWSPTAGRWLIPTTTE